MSQNNIKASSKHIRRATYDDYPRIAEIYVFNNRLEYFPIFNNINFSFSELKVVSYIDELKNKEYENIFVYDDGVIKGFIIINDGEIDKLHIEYFFQNQGIGSILLEYAIKNCNGKYLWALEKNTRAISFYKRHGMIYSGEKDVLYGPNNKTEFIVKMILKENKK